MNILGIETSCDETSAAIVKDGRKTISLTISSQVKEHELYGGVVPEIASRRHIENINKVILECFKRSNSSLSDIDGVAVTFSPGLIGSLLVGVNFAKGFCFATKKPLIAVNHLKAHIAANYLCHEDLSPPFLGLIISGGHTIIVNVLNYCDFKVIGKTLDDSVGEAYDKIGRALNLPYPAGALIDKLAKKGDETKFKFPKPKVSGSQFNFSFSGIKTAVLNTINKEKQNNNEILVEDFAASFQDVVSKIICEKIFLAIKKYYAKKLVIAGGVAANSRIRKDLTNLCYMNNVKIYLPELKYCSDNAAMVASQGFFEFENGNIEKDFSLNAVANSLF